MRTVAFMHTLVGPDLGSVMSVMHEQLALRTQRRACILFFEQWCTLSVLVHGSWEGEGVSKERATWLFATHWARLGDLGIQLPWMALQDTNHLPLHLLPVLNNRFQNSIPPSIFSNYEHFCVFIHKNCQCAMCTNIPLMHSLWLHKCYNNRYKSVLENLGCT